MRRVHIATRRRHPGCRRPLGGFRIESLEARELLSTYTVTDTNDDTNMGSLRWAIGQVNGDSSPDIIDFAITASGLQTITLGSPLPAITNSVMIEGSTQGTNAGAPLIAIDGSKLSTSDSALTVSTASCTIQGLAIVNSPGNGIALTGDGGDSILGSYIGTPDGTTAAGNAQGILVQAPNCTIGGTAIGDGNVISGNTAGGILIDKVTGTLIQGNLIGADAAGTGTLTGANPGSNQDGVDVMSSSDTTIGGTVAGSGNVISGNGQFGIYLATFTNQQYQNDQAALVQGNMIGMDRSGKVAIPNGNNGIDVLGDDSSTIGGMTPAARNIISGNKGYGLYLGGPVGEGSDYEVIEGNYIGTDITGQAAVGNSEGILIGSLSDSTIGGTVPGSGNVISGNQNRGIDTFLIGFGDDLIAGNDVGVGAGGMKAVPNGNTGMSIAGLDGTTIGGTTRASANIISANAGTGLYDGSNNTLVEGNDIGTDIQGKVLGNQGPGLQVQDQDNTIGGTAQGAGNVIANNQGNGIFAPGSGTIGNEFLSNLIYGNGQLGISLGNQTTPTPNTPDEAPVNGNTPDQNYPVLTAAQTSGTSTEIVGSLNAAADTSYLLQFFASPQADPSGYGQGQVYLGSAMVTTGTGGDDANDVNFDITLFNSAPVGDVVSATATDPSNNTSEFAQDVTLLGLTDVGVSIATSPVASVDLGSTLTYTLTVSANGPEPADGVVVTDTLPQDIANNVSVTTSVAGVMPTIDNGVVTADLGTMAAGTTATITIVVQPTVEAGSQVVDQAAVSTQDVDTVPDNDSDSLTTTVVPSADLAVTLTGPGQVDLGQTATYTLSVINNGPSPASDVELTDTLPQDIGPDVTVTIPGTAITPTIADGVVTADLGTLDAGVGASMIIEVQPTASAVPQISDSATLSTTTNDPDLSNNAPAPVFTTVVPVADLQVSIAPSFDSIPAGQDVTYTVTANNNGPSDATGVVLTDTIPADVTFVSASGGATPSGGVLTFDIGDLASGSSAVFSVTVQTLASTASPTTDQAAIMGDQTDPNGANNMQTASVPITPVSDLSLAISAPSQPVVAGGTLTYTIHATNTGPSTDPSAVVVDTLPAGVTFVSATGGATPSDGALSIPLGSLAPGDMDTIVVIVTVNSGAADFGSTTITNSAVINGQDNANNANSASVPTTVDADADLSVSVAPSLGSVPVGQEVTYTVTATDDGPSDATGVVLTDTIPADVTFVSATGGATPSGGVLTFDVGTLAAGSSDEYTVTVQPSSTTASPTTDQAAITGDQTDPNMANNGAQSTAVTIKPVSDLSITMSASPQPVMAGGTLTYTIHATNTGPSTDPDAVVVDTLPAGVTFISATGGAVPSSGTLTIPLGSLAPGATATATVMVTAGAGSATITNSAVINGQDNVNTADSASFQTNVTAAADLKVSVTAGSGSVLAGQDVTYTVTATNGGPSQATGVVLTDTIPGDVSFVSATGGAMPSGDTLTFDIGTVPQGGSEVFSVVVQTSGSTASPTNDQAAITGSQADPDTGNNTAQSATPVTVTPVSDLSIAMSASPQPVAAGGTLTYTIHATNTGPSTDPSAVVVDTLPAGVTFVSATGGASPSGGVLTIPVGNLAPGATSTVTVVVTVTAGGGTTVTNSAVINGQDNTNTANSARTTTPVQSPSGTGTGASAPAGTPPTVQGLQWTGSSGGITSLIVHFSEPMAMAAASNPANYQLMAQGTVGNSGGGSPLGISQATYDAATDTVTLTPSSPLAVNQFYSLVIVGTRGGITDSTGDALAGAGPGQAATNYSTLFAQGTKLTYIDTAGGKVKLTLRKKGYLDDVLTGPGQAGTLVIVGGVKHHTVVKGSVARAKHGKHGPVQPPLAYSIYGMGQPGTVRVRLKSPFVIQENASLPAVDTASPMVATAGMGALSSTPSARSHTRTAAQVSITTATGTLPSGRRAFVAFHRRPARPAEAAPAR